MITDLILFFALALVAVASAAGLLFSRNAIYAALNLILNFATVAVFYLLLGAPFIAVSQIAVYTGAIMVLFLFVIMLLGAEISGAGQADLPWQRPLAFVLGGILLLLGAYVLVSRSGAVMTPPVLAADYGNPAAVGELLFTQYLLPFEITSVLLLVAMIGVVVLTRRRLKTKS
jgi:NADH-quinone oxidoreductase subunit J